MTNTNMLNLRRTIFLTIMSSVNFEECVHKVRRTTAASSLRALFFFLITRSRGRVPPATSS